METVGKTGHVEAAGASEAGHRLTAGRRAQGTGWRLWGSSQLPKQRCLSLVRLVLLCLLNAGSPRVASWGILLQRTRGRGSGCPRGEPLGCGCGEMSVAGVK